VYSPEAYIFPKYKNSLSKKQAITVLLNAAIGAGILRLGAGFRCGILLSLVMTTAACFLNLFALWMLAMSVSATKSSSFIEIWSTAIGRKTLFLPVIGCIGNSIILSKVYINLIIGSIQSLLTNLGFDSNTAYVNQTSILVVVYFVFVLPHVFNTSLTRIYHISIAANICLGYLMLHSIYWFIHDIRQYGFDPKNQLKYVSFDKNAVSLVNSLITAYSVFPISWPGVRHYDDLNYKSLISIFKIESLVCWVLYCTFGAVSYLTFFDKNTGGLILNYYPKGTMRLTGEVALALMIAFTLPIKINVARYSLMEIVFPVKSFIVDGNIWIPLGIVSTAISAFLSVTFGSIEKVMSIISQIASPSLVLLFPPILYLFSVPNKSFISTVGAMLHFIFGVTYITYILYQAYK